MASMFSPEWLASLERRCAAMRKRQRALRSAAIELDRLRATVSRLKAENADLAAKVRRQEHLLRYGRRH